MKSNKNKLVYKNMCLANFEISSLGLWQLHLLLFFYCFLCWMGPYLVEMQTRGCQQNTKAGLLQLAQIKTIFRLHHIRCFKFTTVLLFLRLLFCTKQVSTTLRGHNEQLSEQKFQNHNPPKDIGYHPSIHPWKLFKTTPSAKCAVILEVINSM